MKKLITFIILLGLVVSNVLGQETGFSDKIEDAIVNCKGCNICPDGNIIDNKKVCLYLFWGQGCRHCIEEKVFLEELKQKYPNLSVYEFEVYSNIQNAKLWQEICKKYGIQPLGVPMTFIGDNAFVGFARTGQPSSNNSANNTDLILISLAIISIIFIAIILLIKKVKIKVKQ